MVSVTWVPEVFLACGGNFRCGPKANTSSALGRSQKVSGTQSGYLWEILSKCRLSCHWPRTLSRWPCLLHLLKHSFWKAPAALFEKSRGSKCRCLLSALLQFWVWVGEMRSNMNWSGYIVRPYLLTSNLICQVTGCKRGKLHRPVSFRQPVHCNLEYMYLLTKWFLNSCCHIHKHLYKVA